MATLDPSILLQSQGVQLADPTKQAANAYMLKNMADEQQARQQGLVQQQLLQQAFSQGDLSTPQGQQALIKSVSGIDPARAQALSKQFQEQALQQSTIGKNNAETDASKFKQIQEKQGMVASAASTPLLQYQNLIAKGVPDAQARAQVEPVYQASIMRLQSATGPDGQPLFGQQDFASIPANFDPAHVEGVAQQATKYQDLAKQQLDAQQAIETKRNNLANNATSQQNANAASMNAQTSRGQLANNISRLTFDEQKTMLEYGQKGQQEGAKLAEGLRKEVNDLPTVKSYNQIAPQLTSIRQAANNKSNQGDVHMIYNLAKIYDPLGSVREGDYDAIRNNASLYDKLGGYLNAVRGNGVMSDGLRQKLIKEAETAAKPYEDNYFKIRDDYKSIAGKAGVDVSTVFPSEAKRITPPNVGDVIDGHTFNGGDWHDAKNWSK